MLYGELGVKPISLQIKSRMLCYWSKLLNAKEDKICKILYNTALKLHSQQIIEFPWIEHVKSTLDGLGLAEYFSCQHVNSVNHLNLC